MTPFADVIHLFPDEFARLRARRFPFFCVLAGSPNRLFVGHFASSENTLPCRESRHLADTQPIREKTYGG